MRPNGVKAAMGRLAASLLVAASLAAPALAADSAAINYLGFSEDGRYFGFEEYGIQDGSGFPYSNVFIVDLQEDKWVGDSPFRVRIDSEEARLHQVRAEALAKAQATLDEVQLVASVDVVAMHGDGEVGIDRTSITFGAFGNGLDEEVREPSTLTISSFPSTSTEPCETYGAEPPKGFALELKTPYETTEIYRDTSVPASRGCVVGYRLYAIVSPFYWQWNTDIPVAVISVYSFGFEGPDRRFIVVPVPGLP